MAILQANGIRQFYRAEGDRTKPPLVLAHPVGFDHGIWDSVVPQLVRKFHIVRYDMRGHGGSETTAEDYSVKLLAADALALLAALSIARTAFYGVSLGGLVGLQIAATSPQSISALAVSNLSPRLPLPREEWDRRIRVIRTEGVESFVSGISERMFSPAFRASDSPHFHTNINAFQANDRLGYACALAALRDADLTPELTEVATPTLVMWGEQDTTIPSDHQAKIAQQVRNGVLVALPGGHLSPVEAPEQVCTLLASHLLK